MKHSSIKKKSLKQISNLQPLGLLQSSSNLPKSQIKSVSPSPIYLKTKHKASKNPLPGSQLAKIDPIANQVDQEIKKTESIIAQYGQDLQQKHKKIIPRDLDETSTAKELKKLEKHLILIESEFDRLKKSNSEENYLKRTSIFNHTGINLRKELEKLKIKEKELELLVIQDQKLIMKKEKQLAEVSNVSDRKDAKSEEKFNFFEQSKNLESKIFELKKKVKIDQNLWIEKIKEIQQDIENKKKEVSGLEIALKQKDRDCRLAKMQIKSQQRKNRLKKISRTPDIFDTSEMVSD